MMRYCFVLIFMFLFGCSFQPARPVDSQVHFKAGAGAELFFELREDGRIWITRKENGQESSMGLSDFSSERGYCKGSPDYGCFLASIKGCKNSLFTGRFSNLTARCLQAKKHNQDGEAVMIVWAPEFVEHPTDIFMIKLHYDHTGKLVSIIEIRANGETTQRFRLKKGAFRFGK